LPRRLANSAQSSIVTPDTGTKVYAADNIGGPGTGEDAWTVTAWYEPKDGGGWIHHQPAPDVFRAAEAFTTEAVTYTPTKDWVEQVLTGAGAQPRDAIDERIVDEVRSRGGRVGAGQSGKQE